MDFMAARRNMVATQIKTSAVTDPLVISALEAVPREAFVPPNQRPFAYIDEDLTVGKGRCVMEPAVLARLLQLANVQPDDRALVVAAGTGYSAAVLAQMARTVVAVDSDAALLSHARQACAAVGAAAVTVVMGDPKLGCPEHGPFDVILIDGAVADIPAVLEARLNDGGRLVAIVRRGSIGRATLVTRAGEAYSRREGFDAMTPVLPEFTQAPRFVF
ncbi:MAG: protein-L-isoaspartate O-methyltransferase [Rhodospirillaceae bacterium]|nr:MAG: protein-L-isoaspartate O-methyltransferase [Rhodospirillaceae bacterium]